MTNSGNKTVATRLKAADHISISNLVLEWAESYDLKDWSRLRSILAPSVSIDFRAIKGDLRENLTPNEYVAILSDAKLLGSQRLKTQHLIGGTSMNVLQDGSVQLLVQLRVAHQTYLDDELTQVKNKGHAHGATTLLCKSVQGVWKIASVTPRVEWAEYDLFGTLAGESAGLM